MLCALLLLWGVVAARNHALHTSLQVMMRGGSVGAGMRGKLHDGLRLQMLPGSGQRARENADSLPRGILRVR